MTSNPPCTGRVYLFEPYKHSEESQESRWRRMQKAQEVCTNCPLLNQQKCKKYKNEVDLPRGVWYGKISVPPPRKRKRKKSK